MEFYHWPRVLKPGLASISDSKLANKWPDGLPQVLKIWPHRGTRMLIQSLIRRFSALSPLAYMYSDADREGCRTQMPTGWCIESVMSKTLAYTGLFRSCSAQLSYSIHSPEPNGTDFKKFPTYISWLRTDKICCLEAPCISCYPLELARKRIWRTGNCSYPDVLIFWLNVFRDQAHQWRVNVVYLWIVRRQRHSHIRVIR